MLTLLRLPFFRSRGWRTHSQRAFRPSYIRPFLGKKLGYPLSPFSGFPSAGKLGYAHPARQHRGRGARRSFHFVLACSPLDMGAQRNRQRSRLSFFRRDYYRDDLLDLATAHPAEIQIYPLNKYQEGRLGADWEWCIYDAKQFRFLRMLVQAKVLDNLEREYAHIDRKIGNTGVRQIDRLLETARKRGIPALYAFYNHVSDLDQLPLGNCECRICSCYSCWGCSVALGPGVEAILPDKSFDALKKISKPWACLFCPEPDQEPAAPSLPDHVAIMLGRVIRQAREIVPDASFETRGYGHMVRREPPPYFDRLRALRTAESKAFRDSVIEEIAANNPGVDGIVMLGRDNASAE
jgi:hypothetical protein